MTFSDTERKSLMDKFLSGLRRGKKPGKIINVEGNIGDDNAATLEQGQTTLKLARKPLRKDLEWSGKDPEQVVTGRRNEGRIINNPGWSNQNLGGSEEKK